MANSSSERPGLELGDEPPPLLRYVIVNLTSGGLSGGYRKYLKALVPLLAGRGDARCVGMFFPPGLKEDVVPDSVPVWRWPAWDPLLRHPWLHSRVRELSPDVVFFPTARRVSFDPTPTVVMIRNMEPLVRRKDDLPFAEILKNSLRRWSARSSCREATRIIAVSEYVKAYLVQTWGVDTGKVGVVYHGVESGAGLREGEESRGFEDRFTTPFLFTAGSIRPARGLEDVFRALAVVRACGVNVSVGIAGAVDPGMGPYRTMLDQLAVDLGVASSVCWLGALAEGDMMWCFAHSLAFIMTSRVEACPNLALEALSRGCSIVSTRNPPMPEFFGDTALYYEAGDSKKLAEGILRLVREDAAQKEVRGDRARRQAKRYTWQDTADRTIRELRKACGHPPRNETRPEGDD